MLSVLDIGTNKVAMIIADIKEDGTLEILSVGSAPSFGMKKGMVTNIEKMVESIKRVVEEAEVMAERKVTSVYVGVAGHHIKSVNCDGVAPIRDGEVSQNDIDRAVETAQAIQIASDQQILHVLPRDFAIDGEQGIKDPLGMSGYRLDASVHLITAGINPVQNITKCVKRCGLEVNDIVMESIASSLSVLTEDEKELGTCLVDIGGGTTDIAIFDKGSIIHSSVIPVAGDHVTNDIAVSLRTPTQNAEEIKLKYGCAMCSMVPDNQTLEVQGPSKESAVVKLKIRNLAEIIQPRYEEIFSLVQRELVNHRYEDKIVSGVVLTGGSCKLEGCRELAENIFNVPVRVGLPVVSGHFSNLCHDPIYSTAIGLLYYAYELNATSSNKLKKPDGLQKMWDGVRIWFKDQF